MPRQLTEATARALVLVASGSSVQEAATAAGIAVSKRSPGGVLA